MPRRIQRRRVKGWRLPAGAVYVGRGSRWGNPWRAGDLGPRVAGSQAGDREYYLDPMLAVGAFERLTVPEQLAVVPDWLAPLRGKNLVCWCRLDAPCHADVLLGLANEPPRVAEGALLGQRPGAAEASEDRDSSSGTTMARRPVGSAPTAPESLTAPRMIPAPASADPVDWMSGALFIVYGAVERGEYVPREIWRENARRLLNWLDGHGWQLLRLGKRHVVEFTEGAYGLQHPAACRPNLIDCEYNQRLASAGKPPMPRGRYVMTIDPDGDEAYWRIPEPDLTPSELGGTDG